MMGYLKKLNFLIGIFLVFIFIFIGSIAEKLSRAFLTVIQNIFYKFDLFDVGGGYIDMFYEKLILEGVGTFVYCAVALCGPIFLNKKFFNKLEINWIPSFILIFIFFGYFGMKVLIMFFQIIGKADWIDTLSYIVMAIGYFGGFISAMLVSAKYAEIHHPLIDKFTQ